MARRKGVATTWWGKRWTGAIEALGEAWRNRLPRGRVYAREGRVVGLTVESGRISAYVVGSLPRPYQVTIALRPLTDRQWRNVNRKLAGRAAYAARLLAGEMPDDIEDAFQECGVSLFPARPADLKLACDCPDLASPCKHVAAMHYALGEVFDHDPFLLFALRGRDREAVLAGLRAERAGAAEATPPADVAASGGDVAGPAADVAESGGGVAGPAADVAASRGSVAGPAADVAESTAEPVAFTSWRAGEPDMQFRIEPPPVRLAVLRSLGKPPGWRGRASLAEVLDRTYGAAGELVRTLAFSVDPDERETP